MSTVKKYVDELKEIYQNIYGYPEYDNESSRQCKDRWECIKKIVLSYQQFTKKKSLKILDLGCAQGFYTFSLASLGCVVEGIDFDENNIALCKELRKENNLSCSFQKAEITKEMIDEIEIGQYDIIMIYSVIHHIANGYGFEYARDIMTSLAKKAQFVLTELALKEEPLYWNKNLPTSYTGWFTDVSFYDEQMFFETHLSMHKRPFVFFSNQVCYVDNSFYSIMERLKVPYKGKIVDPERCYYLCDGNSVLIKKYRNVVSSLKKEIENEHRFIEENNDLSFVPECLHYSENKYRIIEVTRIHYGELLRDKIINKKEVNLRSVFRDIINQCIELENRGFYHNDLRPWNICVDNEGHAFIIDFGAIQLDVEDCIVDRIMYRDCYRYFSVFDTFISMMYDCLMGNSYTSIEVLDRYHISCYYEFDKIPDSFSNFIKQYLLIETGKASFAVIDLLYRQYVENEEECFLSVDDQIRIHESQLNALYLIKEPSIRTMEISNGLSHRIDENTMELNRIEAKIVEVCEWIQNEKSVIQNELTNTQSEIKNAQSKIRGVQAGLDEAKNQNKEIQSGLDAQMQKVIDLSSQLKNRVDLIDLWLPLRTWRKLSGLLKRK